MLKITKSYLIVILFLLIGTHAAQAQNFRGDLKKLNAQIKEAHKSKKLTDLEYSKLQREHDIILAAIEKAEADDIVTPDEKNKIHSKIVRSKKRLAKYKTNREIY